MMKYNNIFFILMSIPKTIFFNIRVFGLKKGIRLPVFVAWNVKIDILGRHVISIPDNIKTASIKIGVGGTSIMNIGKSAISLPAGGTLQFLGRAHLAAGCCIKNTGKMVIGDYFSANNNCRITCSNSISIGDKAMLGWNVVIRDSDGHYIIDNGVEKAKVGSVYIGNHVWICSEAHLLKGTTIGDDCVVAYRSLVTSKFEGNNLLLAGSPAKIKKSNVNWKQ